MEVKAQASPQGRRVKLLGLDFGSTTSSALVAEAEVGSNCQTGRMEFGEPRIVFRSEPVFTPFDGERIDAIAIETLMKGWFEEAGLERGDVFAGGTLITGLAAKRRNATALARLVGETVGETVVATADDPCLESWLAFMGSCSTLSRFHSTRALLNLDIGGGTTNPALGRNGNVTHTGCYFVGARHFQFEPGGYVLTGMSDYGRALIKELGIKRQLGETLEEEERRRIIEFFVHALEAMVAGTYDFFAGGVAWMIEQSPFRVDLQESSSPPIVTFSGGVGELLYRHVAGEPMPGTTFYGDLGIDLALAIIDSPILNRDLSNCVPENRGRATVYGLTLHCTEVSGATLFLPNNLNLPLRDLPIVARVSAHATDEEVRRALAFARKASGGACMQILLDGEDTLGLEDVRRLGGALAQGLREAKLPLEQPLVLLLEPDAGKVLGQYATDWGRIRANLIVIDEVRLRNAHFVNIGRPHRQVLPIAFFGMH